MRFLIFVSIVFCLLAGCSPKAIPISSRQPDLLFWLPHLRDSVQSNRYRMELVRDKASISGIWIVKRMDDTWRGTLVNEFGMKMFDFICTANKCELQNMVAMVDKWYIKKTIAGDVQFMLEMDNPAYKKGRMVGRKHNNDTLTVTYKKKKILQRLENDEMVMNNQKHNLTYSFRKMVE